MGVTRSVRSAAPARTPPWGWASGSGAWAGAVAAVFTVAVLARLILMVRGAGFGSNLGYDASVYYAAGDGLTHGRLPYRDFVLLHPPGIMLVLAPFALLGRATADHVGFVVANLAFTAIGAANAALVTVIARRLGASRTAAICGGLFAALWIGSVQAEYLARLEPLANLGLLVGLYAYARARRRPTTASFAVVGAALAAASSVKIWYVVPLLMMAGWVVLRTRARAPVLAFAAGATVVGLAIDGPFFWLAPGPMLHMVVTDQLGRTRSAVSPLSRFLQANDAGGWTRALGGHPAATVVGTLVVGALVLVVGALVVSAARQAAGRAVVVVLGAQVLALALAPSWFTFYADYLTPALAVSLALGVDGVRLGAWRTVTAIRHPRVNRSTTVAIAFVTALALAAPTWWVHVGTPFPRARLSDAVAASPCVVADSPMALIELDALSRSFAPGCRDWVDVTGRTYGADRMNTSRTRNTRWQRDVRDYLLSGNAFIVIRGGTGLSARTRAELRLRPVLTRAGPYVIYRGRSPVL